MNHWEKYPGSKEPGYLFIKNGLLQGLLNSDSNANGHTDHRVVACAQEAHHFHVGGDGGRTCELSIAMHTAHGIGQTVGSGTCSHVIGVQSTAGAAAGSNGEVLLALLDALLLVGTCNGVLESGRVGGVTGDGNVNTFVTEDRNAFENVVCAVALDLCLVAVRVCLFINDSQFVGVEVIIGADIGEAVDSGNDECSVLAKTAEDNAEGLLANLVRGSCDTDSTFCSCEGFVTCEEAEALGFFAEKHCSEVAVAETNLAVFSYRTRDAECLKTDTDRCSSVSSLGAALLDCDSCAYGVCPLCVFEADGLGFFYDLVGVDALLVADFLHSSIEEMPYSLRQARIFASRLS